LCSVFVGCGLASYGSGSGAGVGAMIGAVVGFSGSSIIGFFPIWILIVVIVLVFAAWFVFRGRYESMGARLVLYLLLYIAFASFAVSAVAGGMGYTTGGLSDNPDEWFSPPDEDSFLDGIPIIGETADTAAMVASFLACVFTVMFWNIDPEIFPWFANVVLIKVPLIGLIGAIVELILP